MIDTETVKFIGELNRLAGRSENGIYPFSTATKEQMYGLLYDDRKPLHEGGSVQLGDTTIVFDDCYPLIADCLIDNEHHDIISTYTQMYDADDIVIGVMTGAIDEEGEAWIAVTSKDNPDLNIVIKDGVWYQS